MSRQTLTLPTFAKINWSLRVLNRRPDGYHELDTVLQTISLHDTITLKETDDYRIELRSDDPLLPLDETNLVLRAATALRSRYPTGKGACINLKKRIPTQAGLGGGSSNAAVTLIGLAHLWRIDVTAKNFLELAADLGSDVPFFLYGGTAHGRGIGTELTPLRDAPERHLLVLKPNKGVPTVRAYARLIRSYASLTTVDAKTILSSSEWSGVSYSFDSETLQNDFEPVVFELEPEVSRAKVALMKAGAEAALLAGSGSAVFGIFDSEDALKRAIQAIELESGWRVFPCSTVGRSHYQSAMGPCGAVFGRFTGR